MMGERVPGTTGRSRRRTAHPGSTPWAFSLLLLSALGLGSVQPLLSQGVLIGDSGGNEREVAIFDRAAGQIWHTVTGVTGRFRSRPLPPGEYLAISGSIFTPVRIENARATELLFSGQAGFSADTETWSPARSKFGQTFRAIGPSVDGFQFWNPGETLELVAELRKSGPDGQLVARRDLGKTSWIRIVDLQPGEWRTEAGETYYLSIASANRTPFRIGMPALGDVYAFGTAHYDDQPTLDSDLGIAIRQDGDGLRTLARVTLHEGFGFREKGPASGSPVWAAQTFVANARNLRTAWINAGWPSSEGPRKRFIFSVHKDSPLGEQVGPSRQVSMIKDWGATAVWFDDQVPLDLGQRYAVRIQRSDGEPFYAYLAPDRYAHGRAIRAGLPTEDMDLTCVLRGELTPGSTILPCNVRVEQLSSTSATFAWDSARATTSRLELLTEKPRCIENTAAAKRHRLTVDGLKPGRRYRYRVGGTPDVPGARTLLSKIGNFTTLSDPTLLERSASTRQDRAGRAVPLTNPSFEDGLDGWTVSPPTLLDQDPPLPPDVGNLRAVYYLGRYSAHSGKRALGWNHRVHEKSGPVPRKIDPAITRIVSQVVETEPGGDYELSAWILTDERQGGWNRNDRVRLVVDTSASSRLHARETVDERFATQWYTTRGQWRRFRLRFRAEGAKAAIGVQLYQWWLLAENHVYVDDLELHRLPGLGSR